MTQIMKNRKWTEIGLICSIVLLILFIVYTSSTGGLNSLNNVVLQIVLAGISIYTGRRSIQQVTKPHAQSAVRRLSTLCRALYSAAYLIHPSQRQGINTDYEVLLARLQEIISWQLSAAIDALKDWSDFASEDVAKTVKEFEPDNTTEENNDYTN